MSGAGDSGARADAAASLDRIAEALPVRLRAGEGGEIYPVPGAAGPQGALTAILLIAARAAATGTWNRLKACAADDCRWAFYDRSPAGNGCWCSMRVCGARAKSRAYRRRTAARP